MCLCDGSCQGVCETLPSPGWSTLRKSSPTQTHLCLLIPSSSRGTPPDLGKLVAATSHWQFLEVFFCTGWWICWVRRFGGLLWKVCWCFPFIFFVGATPHFLLSDPISSIYLIYFIRSSLSNDSTSCAVSDFFSLSGSISSNRTFSSRTISEYVAGVSDQRLYLLHSGLIRWEDSLLRSLWTYVVISFPLPHL